MSFLAGPILFSWSDILVPPSPKPRARIPEPRASRLEPDLIKILSCHPQPQRPVVPAVVAPDVQPVRYSLRVQHSSHLYILIQAHVPVGRCQYDLHLPVPAQEPVVVHVGQVIRGTVEVT